MKLAPGLLLPALFALGSAAQAQQPDTSAVLNTVLPAAVETELALSAAPAHLREGATVYVYGPRGYEKTRQGTNGFTCLLNRDSFLFGQKTFNPTCWDKVGEDSYVPVMLRAGELLSQRATVESVRRDIAEGFASGKFHAPKAGGISYMLAGTLNLDLKTGKVLEQTFPGHYMLYQSGVTNAQLGTTRDAMMADPTLPFASTNTAGGEHGLGYVVIVPGDAHKMPHGDAQ